jgi:hypothetical protein
MNIFLKIKSLLTDGPIAILVFLASVAMLIIGIVHGLEDVLSTYYGIQLIQNLYNIRPVILGITYITTACSFSVGQIILLYVYLANTQDNKRIMIGYFALFVLDTVVDVYYRSNGFAFPSNAPGAIIGNISFSFMITLIFYTVFSEVFLTMGFALTFQMLAPAIIQWKRLLSDIRQASKNIKTQIDSASKKYNYPSTYTFKPSKQSGFDTQKLMSIVDRKHPKKGTTQPTRIPPEPYDEMRYYEQ